MGSKRGRGAPALIMQQDESQNPSEVSSLSTIDKASFLEGLQKSNGNRMQSTAVEEDLSVLDEEHVDEGKPQRKQVPRTLKTTVTQRGAAVKRKRADTGGEIDTEVKRSRRSAVETVRGRPEKGRVTKKKKGDRAELDVLKESHTSSSPQKSDEPAPEANSRTQLVGKQPANRKSAVQTSAARPVRNKQMKTENREKNKSRNGKSDGESQEECESGITQHRRRKILSSEEEADEDTSWNPSPQNAKVYSLSRTRKSSSNRTKSRKSSSGSSSAGAQRSGVSEQKKRRVHRGSTDLEVVLDAFLDFCDQYRESVESKAAKQSIDCFSNNVKEQLLEKISSNKELKVLKRENTKVNSLIRRKTQRLLDAKQELMRAERQVWLLQKEETELKLRLADLRRGHGFLRDITELNRQYLDHRGKHPKEKEMYGASSLPALLLETKHIDTAERQLKQQ